MHGIPDEKVLCNLKGPRAQPVTVLSDRRHGPSDMVPACEHTVVPAEMPSEECFVFGIYSLTRSVFHSFVCLFMWSALLSTAPRQSLFWVLGIEFPGVNKADRVLAQQTVCGTERVLGDSNAVWLVPRGRDTQGLWVHTILTSLLSSLWRSGGCLPSVILSTQPEISLFSS